MSGKILRLQIEAFKGIQNLDLDWDNEYAIMALIADGGLGKSSVLEFVETCLNGIVPESAINELVKKAKGSLLFEKEGKKYTVEISKTKKSETVKIRSDNNMSGGKEVLRDIVGSVAIAPFSIMKMDADEQTEEFKKIFKIDTSALTGKRKAVYDQRTLINGQIKSIRNTLQQAQIINAEGVINKEFTEKMTIYQEEKLVGDIPDKLKKAREDNEKLGHTQNLWNQTQDKINDLENDITELDKQILLLQEQRNNKKANVDKLGQENATRLEYLKSVEPVDLSEIEKELKEINDHNTERSRIIIHISKIQEMEELQEQSATKTKALKDFDKEIEDYIKKAIPENLGSIKLYEPKTDPETGAVTEDRKGIYWNEKPVSILSKTEAITFGMELKSAVNPNGLSVLLLDDFESVGSLGVKALNEMAQKGWQALIAEMDLKQSNLKIVLKKDLTNVKEDKTIKETQPVTEKKADTEEEKNNT